jgi:hypothetical protein
MSILIDEQTKVLVQGITGRDGSFHALSMVEYGTKVVGGGTPGKAGQKVGPLPVFNSVAQALEKVEVDVSGYKESRTKSLKELSLNLAEKVIKTKRSIELEPMSSQERKIIHNTLKKKKNVYTYSKGEEPNRKVIISCTDKNGEQGKRGNGPRKPRRRKKTEPSEE